MINKGQQWRLPEDTWESYENIKSAIPGHSHVKQRHVGRFRRFKRGKSVDAEYGDMWHQAYNNAMIEIRSLQRNRLADMPHEQMQSRLTDVEAMRVTLENQLRLALPALDPVDCSLDTGIDWDEHLQTLRDTNEEPNAVIETARKAVEAIRNRPPFEVGVSDRCQVIVSWTLQSGGCIWTFNPSALHWPGCNVDVTEIDTRESMPSINAYTVFTINELVRRFEELQRND